MQENGISSELDAIRPSQCCSDLPDNCYRPAYVGPNYGGKTKILFVGLDPGTSATDGVPKTLTAQEWQRWVFFDGYRKQASKKNESWNGHYRGCVRMASALLRMACEARLQQCLQTQAFFRVCTCLFRANECGEMCVTKERNGVRRRAQDYSVHGNKPLRRNRTAPT
jgi:hypothetical protein